MMRITINKNANGLVTYFSKSLSKDEYYVDGHCQGYWHGKLAKELALPNKVTKKDFSALAHNKDPNTGEKLSIRNRANRRVSTEYMFSAPKSVSIVMMLGDEQIGRDILNLHRRSVKRAMQAIEQDVHTQKNVSGRNVYLKTGTLIYARFDHRAARPLKDEETGSTYPDPLLHSHCIVPNLTMHNGEIRAIEGSIIHREAGYYEAIYHSELTKGLKDMGIGIRKTKDRWEIDTPLITRELIERFSRRTIEINKEAKSLGITNPKLKAELGAKTRRAKNNDRIDQQLIQTWKNKLSREELKAIENITQESTQNSRKPVSAKDAVERSLAHFLERQSTVSTKRLIAHALKLGYGDVRLEDVEKALNERNDLLHAQKRYVQYLTTKSMVRAEDRMINFASQTKNTERPINAGYTIKRSFLSEQQKEAVQHILKSKNKVSILMGGAGTGKTTLLSEIKQGALENGKTVFAFAPSTVAREELRKEGFGRAETISALKINQKLQAQLKNQIMLIDEAGLLGTKSMNELMDIAKKQNARMILSGDVKQHNSPGEAGDAKRILIEKSGLPVAKIEDIQRQKNKPEYKKAIEMIATGRVREGFDKLDQMKVIKEIDDFEVRNNAIAQHHVRAIEKGRSVLTICPTKNEGQILNNAIRSEMKVRGRVKGEDIQVRILKAMNLTEAEMSDHQNYEAGQVVQFHQNVKGFKAGNQYEVKRIDKKGGIMISPLGSLDEKLLPIQEIKKYQMYQASEISLAQGDQIKITRNGKSTDKSSVYNGQVYEVEKIVKDGHIKLRNGKILHSNFGHLAHSYVMTSHASQGRTCDEVIIAQSSLSIGASNAKQFYVSSSRAKYNITIYTDDKSALKQAITRSGERMSASEIASRVKQTELTKARRQYYQFINQKNIRDERIKGHDKNDIQRTLQY